MAHKTYNELWRHTMNNVIYLLDIESTTNTSHSQSALPTPSTKAANDKSITHTSITLTTPSTMYHHYATLYISYLSVLRSLEDCYDQIAHPQKRKEIIFLLNAVMGRMLEVYDLLVLLSGSEYIVLEDVLMDLKLTPSALTMSVPRYFKEERARELEERDKLLTALLAQYSVKQEGVEKTQEVLPQAPNMSLEEAIRIIQVNERGRQGRRKAKEARDARTRDKDQVVRATNMDPESAAILIQKTFRGHLTRKKTKAMREEELVFLGMKPPHRKKDVDPIEKADATRARRKLIQNQNELEYQQAVVQIRQSLMEQEGPDMKEKMQDDIRKYFLAHKEQIGKFPAFPTTDDGGSSKLLNPLMVPPSPSSAAVKSAAPKPAPPTAKGAKGAKASASSSKTGGLKSAPSTSKPGAPTAKPGFAKPTAKGSKKEAAGSANSFAPNIPPSCFLADIHTAAQKYLSLWADRDEEANFAQKHEVDLVRETLRPQVEAEIRKQVDEILREELENLKNAVEKKKPAKKKGKKKKGDGNSDPKEPKAPKEDKGEKKEKKKKGKKGNKDPTADRSIQSLYAELVSMNIVVNCPQTKLHDFVAVYNYNFPPPAPLNNPQSKEKVTLFGISQAVMNLCILPLGGSTVVSSNLPPPVAPRSLLLVAPAAYGKSMLCNIIANETGALLLNLDPANLSNANTSRSMSLVIHMVFKVAKAMAPTVIYIDNVEKVFMKPKKKPKKEEKKAEGADDMPMEDTPKKLGIPELAIMMKKELVAQINQLQPGDRVLVVGMTKQPAAASTGGGAMGFDRQLLLTYPDHVSLASLWGKLVLDGSRDLAQGENVILARLTEGIPAGLIQKVIDTVVKGNADKNALTSQDFVPHVAKLPDAKELKEDLNQCTEWWASGKHPIRSLTKPDAPTPPPTAKGEGKKAAAKAVAKAKK